MKTLPVFVAALLLLVGLGWLRPAPAVKTNSINPVLGDASFQAVFGRAPEASDNDQQRIATHLRYVELLLRRRDVQHLPAAQQRRRTALLDHLHSYWAAGVFPANEAYANQRRPCFIDNAGRICAVGYLVEQSAGRGLAERINQEHQYDYIQDMRTPELLAWVGQSGLTLRECAMIQPTYWGPDPGNPNYISPAYGISTAVLSGVNVPVGILNGVRAAQPSPATRNTMALVGLLTGLGQATLGAATFPGRMSENAHNESKKAVAMLNMGLGTSTAVLSIWNLAAAKKARLPRTTYGVVNYTSPTGQPGGGLLISHRF